MRATSGVRIVASAALALSLAGSALAQPTVGTASGPARRIELDGLPVYVQPRATDRISLRVYISTRGVTEAEAPLAELTAAWMVVGGSRSFAGREYTAATKALGIEVDAHARRDLLVFDASVEPAEFRPSARLFADIILYPAFARSQARRAARRAVPRATVPAETLALARRAGIGPPRGSAAMAPGVASTPAAKLTREDAVGFHARHVGIDRAVLVVTGPVDSLELEREVRAAFVGFRRAEVAPAASSRGVGRGGSVLLPETSAGRARLLLVRRGLHRSAADWLPVELAIVAGFMSEPFGPTGPSRLLIEQPLTGPDLLVFELDVRSHGLRRVAGAYDGVFDALARGRIDAHAVERARSYLASALVPPADAAHAASAHALLEALGLGGESPADRHARLLALDARTVARKAAEHLGGAR